MTNILTIPVDIARLDAAHAAGILKQGNWGDGTHAVCMMSALVPSARNTEACVTAGWPAWLVDLNISIFDRAETPKAAWEFARSVAETCAHSVDFDAARDKFLIAVLAEGEHSASARLRKVQCDETWWKNSNKAVDTVAALLTRRLGGEDVDDLLAEAAWEAEEAARAAGAWAAAAAEEDAAWVGSWVAEAAAFAAEADAQAATAATTEWAAYRTHLINALINSRVEV
jgi:hypothetical protein